MNDCLVRSGGRGELLELFLGGSKSHDGDTTQANRDVVRDHVGC